MQQRAEFCQRLKDFKKLVSIPRLFESVEFCKHRLAKLALQP